MIANTISTAFITDKIAETRDFYTKYFNAQITFDCGWYINMKIGNDSATLQFMSPQQPEHLLGSGDGLIYNFAVNDVDSEYQNIIDAKLPIVMPLEDHPWGDRGFATRDPNGISLYIYSLREPTEEFKPYFK